MDHPTLGLARFPGIIFASAVRGGIVPRLNHAHHLEKVPDGFAIKKVELTNETKATLGDDAKFQEVAAATKKACPVSKALAGVPEITLEAKLV